MIHVFHGFLGSPEDFSFLKRDDVKIHDLYQFETPVVGPEDTLIGYSMGGRIALDLASSLNFNIKKLVLINAHPGLSDDEEKMNRKEFEAKIIQELNSRELDDFMEFWNNLPIFFHDAPLELRDEKRFKSSAALFDKYRLSDQKDFLPQMVKHTDKILYVVGLFDEKYMDMVSEVFIPNGISVKGIPGGHRLFQQASELKKILTDEGIL